MAILGPNQLPLVCRVDSNPLKLHALSQLGHPNVLVEISEVQMEQILRSTGDWIVKYFPLIEKYAYFMTQPLVAEYPIPEDAYWVRDISWDPYTTSIQQIFGLESYLFNIGSVLGYQGLLTDYHLLQSYRKFSQRILATEGQWQFNPDTNTIRLFPVPRGSFPVVVRYLPIVTDFSSPQAREITYRAVLARVKEAVGHARRKLSGLPGPDGGSISTDGDALVTAGIEEYKQVQQDAINLGEPLPVFVM